jgi:hypothetical protein
MGTSVLQLGCTIQCPHGGSAICVTQNARVKLGGAPALLVSDSFTVVGCSFPPSGPPSPCVTIEWQAPAARVKVGGTPVLLETSIGLCKAATQAVQGPAVVSGVQTRVKAS